MLNSLQSTNTGVQIFLMYLITILMLLFTVTIHEIGHFIVGRIFKVHVKEISIGVGFKLFKWTTKSGMRVSIKIFPLIAYVMFDSHQLRKMYEDEIDDKDYNWYISPCPEGKLLLEDTKTWQYILIMLAGITMNLLCFFILWPICYATFDANGYIYPNPFVQLGQSIKAICYCMVFKGGAGSNVFVEIPDLAGQPAWGIIFFNLLVIMNLVTGVFNIIPFPPLDGWKVVSRVYYKYTNKHISENTETILSFIGIGLLFYIFISSILVRWLNW